MRLVCPKCVAQYEVDDQAIPETGREVQCANCEHIWFQDSIQMLPEKGDALQKPITAETFDEEEGIFDDLEGVGEAVFQSTRDENAPVHASDAPDDDLDDVDLDDDEPSDAHGFERPPVDDEVLEVLKNEAAFSSARAKLDAAAAQSLDGEPETAEPEELAVFLSAQEADEESEAGVPASEEDIVAASEDAAGAEFDPLGDLDAIRAQLSNLEEEDSPVQYDPVLPQDDPVAADFEEETELEKLDFEFSATEDEEPVTEEHAVYDEEPEPIYDEAPGDDPFAEAIAASLADEDPDAGSDEPPEVDDDFDEERPRRAYRADGAGQDADADAPIVDDSFETDEAETDDEPVEVADAIPEDFDEDDGTDPPAEDAIVSKAALGAMRPRVKSGTARVRTIPGAEEFQEQAAQKARQSDEDDVGDESDGEVAPDTDVAASIRRNLTANDRPASRNGNGGSRKELLPDVEELDSTLRGGSEAPVRDLESMADDDQGGGSSFRSSFIRAFFFIALFIALYMMRPVIVDAIPATAVVLDPYASFIDSVRLMIDGLVTNVTG